MQTLTLRATDGHALAADLFSPELPRGAVLVAPAMGVRRRYYHGFCAFLAASGLAALVIDYRGVGGSGPPTTAASLHDWGELDLTAAARWLAERFPVAPRLYVAHSVGGQLLGLVDAEIDAALFVASQSGHWRQWRGAPRLGMLALWYAIPALTRIAGRLPMRALGQGEDVPAGVAREWASWGRDRAYLWRYAGPRGGARYLTFRGPLRSYAVADDAYAPVGSVEALLALYRAAASELRVVEPGALGVDRVGHFGFFRPAFQDTLWAEARDWLLERVETG